MRHTDQAKQVLSDYFGYAEFRPQQETIISSILEGRDTLVLMPTGGGKSICYQVPAILHEGLAIIISPLIALMKDQVEALKANGVPAAFLNSSLTPDEEQKVLYKASNGELEMLYVSPERALSLQITGLIARENIAFIAVDEAHCVSSWGHDFRPEYAQLFSLRHAKPSTPFIALTATADRTTRIDIEEKLGLENPNVFVSSFDRPNIRLTVAPGQDRLTRIRQFLRQRTDQAGIVYCLSKKSTEILASKLCDMGYDAAAYHGGMNTSERNRVQDNFIHDRCQIVCATIAFGMGIDKSNVRWVIHYNLPKNIESYYQEIGRSGRDGASADTLLLYSFADVIQYRKFIENIDNQVFKDTQLSKLDRMSEFAQADTCRRKILLSYFGEILEDDCGHCDNCQNPPETIDGTIITQKALSVVARARENVATGMLVHILRGSQTHELLENGWQTLKTYGAGKDISYAHWMQYVQQLVQQGMLEIAYHQHQALKLTSLAKQVLFEGKQVQLIEARDRKQAVKDPLPIDLEENVDPELFNKLRQLRTELAREKSVPPYVIFSDKTLQAMAAQKPTDGHAFAYINGVGKQKITSYGNTFVQAICSHTGTTFVSFDPEQIEATPKIRSPSKVTKKTKLKTSTVEQTLEVLHQYPDVNTIEEIAELRSLNPVTIEQHIVKLYSNDQWPDLSAWLPPTILDTIKTAQHTLDNETRLKPYFDLCKGQVSYRHIRFALAVLEKEKAGDKR